MLTFTITNRKNLPTYTPAVYQHPPPIVSSSAISPTIFSEIMRREKIITGLVETFPHKVGDLVEPVNPQDVEKYGKCTIHSICDQYIHLEKDHKWPKNDNPMLVTASCQHGTLFYATTNYFKDKLNVTP